MTETSRPLMEVRNLTKFFPIRRGLLKRTVGYVRAVDNISFDVYAGETLGLVGESGCGKTTAGRSLLRLIEPTGGDITFHGEHGSLNVRGLDKPGLRSYRQQVQIIFQDPYSSLDPRMSVADIVSEPLRIHRVASGSELEGRVANLLKSVGLQAAHLRRYPHSFSGGQRQRIGIARALALEPRMIICDEPVSALDVSIQAQVLNLLEQLQDDLGLTYIFISHDLNVVDHISDRVAVMYVGKIVELAATAELFAQPMHPYTEALISALPKPDPRFKSKRVLLSGDVANPANPPTGCYFHPRCRYAQDICTHEAPPLVQVGTNPLSQHLAACHFADRLSLAGVALAKS